MLIKISQQHRINHLSGSGSVVHVAPDHMAQTWAHSLPRVGQIEAARPETRPSLISS